MSGLFFGDWDPIDRWSQTQVHLLRRMNQRADEIQAEGLGGHQTSFISSWVSIDLNSTQKEVIQISRKRNSELVLHLDLGCLFDSFLFEISLNQSKSHVCRMFELVPWFASTTNQYMTPTNNSSWRCTMDSFSARWDWIMWATGLGLTRY